ncbi:MAG: GNAT family N-acetyltransferase [Terricaulis sp.]
MTIAIRPCTPDDAPRLSLIARATFLATYAHMVAGADILAHCAEKLSASAFAAWFDEPAVRLWLAEAPLGAPVGYVALCAPDLPVALQSGDLELRRIYVLQGMHGSGAGDALMNAALEYARVVGAPRVLLGVNRENHRALAFYAKHRFTQVGTRQFKVGASLYDDFVLARVLG